ncbi:nuclear receptor coactivator 5 [Bicyclus anynana]|uniref:Nuclear receptor coactivator 5 n=1 Tax=Bicyclus anynana TaxID=110368 RepID=A0ABM3LRP0_BICAN|nr:nuclear receptor coactivator 5 [Bicyclus anynana]
MADKLTLDKQQMKDRATAHLRIYVGGIKEETDVDDLYNHFIEYGQIDGILVSRVFGFVQFNQESSANEAIAKANGSMLMGKKITVRPANINGPNTRQTEVVIIQSDKPPAVALTDNTPVAEVAEEPYDNYGNYVGDQNYGGDEYEETGRDYGRDAQHGGPRGRGRGRGRGRIALHGGFRDHSPPRGGNEWSERGYERFSQPEYPRALPLPDKNDCEIIVVSKLLTEYAEYIESRLKRLGIVVDLLFPMEDVPIGKVLGNIASRGCLYAILVMPLNQEHRSLTLTILHGLPQEHRNIPLEDALHLMSRNFQEVKLGGPSGREAVYALLGQLADGRSLTVLQYDKVMEYLQERREQQVKLELGEPLTSSAPATKTQADLQQRILSILNDKSAPTKEPPKPEPQNKLLNDPTVRKALDSILQKFV